MARYPGSIYKPITARKGRRAFTVYNRMNAHIAVSESSTLHGYFNQSGIPDSHFYIRRGTSYQLKHKLPATVEQYVDTALRAFADLEGNDATISVETQGGLRNVNSEKWDISQMLALANIYAWCVKTHGIKLRMATSSAYGLASKGLSWHRLGVPYRARRNANGTYSLTSIATGYLQSHKDIWYSRSAGKTCPGTRRIKQLPEVKSMAGQILAGKRVVPSQPKKSKPSERNWLEKGDTGPKVLALQKHLNKKFPSLSKLEEDSIYGVATEGVVKKVQRELNLTVDGVAGPDTNKGIKLKQKAPKPSKPSKPAQSAKKRRPKALPRLRKGKRKGAYHNKLWQEFLVSQGYRLATDRIFGPATEAATYSWQRKVGLVPDGIVGPQSWSRAALNVRNGSRGAAVKIWQRIVGFTGKAADGIFGKDTARQTKEVQRWLKVVPDAWVGMKTINAYRKKV